MLTLATPQASLLPAFISAAVILPDPVASKYTTTFCARAVGATLSSTVTVAVALALLPLLSVTVNVTVLVWPTSLQLNTVLSKLIPSIPQLSLLPLST